MHAAGMLDHIAAHSRQVSRVAVFLAQALAEQGLFIDAGLVEAAALLHDITKTRSLHTGENHAATGGEYLAARGYLQVGRIVAQHVRLERYFSGPAPDEAEIVNYADKRVLHERIVSLDERMDYILERYGQKPDRREHIIKLADATRRLERRLFGYLPFGPGVLAERLGGPTPPPVGVYS
jgi:putative nucleotidyltransferase with HDIG domain